MAQALNERGVPSGVDTSRPWIDVASEKMNKLKTAYLKIMITAPRSVRDAAGDCLGSIWDLGEATVTDDRDDFSEAVRATMVPRDAVRNAMREDLQRSEEWT